MASYTDLYALNNNSDLKNRITVATLVAAETVRAEAGGTANHANRLIWAQQVFDNPAAIAQQMFWAVIAANNTATIANITGATDAAIQTNVDAAVDLFADGS